MKKEPFLTVFTPNYNSSKYISETIESILNQSYSNFEYIIIDDCSIDNSWEIIQKYAKKDARIKVYRNNKNLKIVKTRNLGFKTSSPKAKYFAIIDSDDISLPDRLETQVDFLENNPEYGLIGSNIIIINENSEIIGFRKFPLKDNEIHNVITRFNPIAQSSVLLRKIVIEQIGFYHNRWEVCQDYDYWLRVGISWKLANIERPLIKYRFSKTQVKVTNFKESLKNTYLIQKKAIKIYGYSDNLFNKLYRTSLKLLMINSKLSYILFRFMIKNQRLFKLI